MSKERIVRALLLTPDKLKHTPARANHVRAEFLNCPFTLQGARFFHSHTFFREFVARLSRIDCLLIELSTADRN